VNFRREFDSAARGLLTPGMIERNSLGQQAFHRMISLERRRVERSGKSFLLMLLDVSEQGLDRNDALVLNKKIMFALSPITRETDIIGWYKENSVVGLVFTEIMVEDLRSVTAIMNRISKTLKAHLSAQQFSDINMSFRLLPEAHEDKFIPVSTTSLAYPVVSAVSDTETTLVAGERG
jgi:hypothetical protein